MISSGPSTEPGLPSGHATAVATAADPEGVRAALGRILASPLFSGAERLSRFLRFAVEQVLDGHGDRLKEYVLGVEVFDRDERYDPRLDSIVRVEARRLRSKLAEYYASEGAADPIVIELPKGSYVPRFNDRASAAAVPTPAVAAPSSRRWRVSWLVTALLVALTTAGVLAVRWGRDVRGHSRGTTGMTLAVLPFVDHGGGAGVADRLTDGVIGELTRTSQFAVRSRTSIMQFKGVRRPMRDIAAALDADLLMEGSVSVEGGTLIAEARLVDAAADRKLWAEEFEGVPTDLRDLQRRIAAAATAAVHRPRR
jgi:TolB-like protein